MRAFSFKLNQIDGLIPNITQIINDTSNMKECCEKCDNKDDLSRSEMKEINTIAE